MVLTEDLLEQIIDDIHMLNIEADRIIVTGSVALCVYGLKKEFHDVDIIVVNPTKGCWADLLCEYETKSNDNYSIIKAKHPNYDIDIFRESFSDEHPITRIDLDGEIWLSTLDCIIKAKKSLNRDKDHSDFEAMQKELRDLIES